VTPPPLALQVLTRWRVPDEERKGIQAGTARHDELERVTRSLRFLCPRRRPPRRVRSGRSDEKYVKKVNYVPLYVPL
jgi:hypothetical protein